ncbi:MAG: hypothetical protein JW983_02150 [Elusimicrobia bacterium]|nr:hypothetical protein [Elusimicrobiota bacterium]
MDDEMDFDLFDEFERTLEDEFCCHYFNTFRKTVELCHLIEIQEVPETLHYRIIQTIENIPQKKTRKKISTGRPSKKRSG